MNIGEIDLPEFARLAPNFSADPRAVALLRAQVEAADLDPAHVTTWMRAGVLILPPTAWIAKRGLTQEVNEYITTARFYRGVVGGDEEYASWVAAAGYDWREVPGWAVLPPVEDLMALSGLRKFVHAELDPDTPIPAPHTITLARFAHRPSTMESDWVREMRS